MTTQIIRDTAHIPTAAELIRSGGLVAVPTETVYGLCVNGLNAEAVHALYEVKGRPEIKPLSLMVPGKEAMDRYCRHVPAAAYALADRFWPGPLTIILPAVEEIPSITLAGGDSVGLRCPDHPMTLALLREAGVPLAGPSANPSGSPSPKTAEEVRGYFDGKIHAIMDGGPCGLGRESTILDMAHTPYRILRQGALSAEDIDEALRASVYTVGITGGTGCGKTTALEVLREQGALLLDCDAIYHELLTSCPAMLSAIEKRFPGTVEDGQLQRKKLGAVVFGDPSALADLNEITHGFVAAEVRRRITDHARMGGTLCAVDAIALMESGLAGLCDVTVAVTAPEEERCARIVAREGISREYALQRIRAQRDNAFFADRCDCTLENTGTMEEFEMKCRELFSRLREERA